MSTVKSPPEKKKAEYERDHRTKLSRNPHAFRKYWPIKQAKKTRAYRRKVSRLLHAATVEPDLDAGSVRRDPVKKSGVMSLREDLLKRKRARRGRTSIATGEGCRRRRQKENTQDEANPKLYSAIARFESLLCLPSKPN